MRAFSWWLAAALSVAVVLPAAGPRLPLGLDLYRPVPEDNALTPAKIDLGRRLFHDRRLSRDGSKSCATCHEPNRAFADNRVVSVGVAGGVGRRNVPAIINRAWGRSFFWDGRAATLEQQAVQPLFNPLELGGSPRAVLALIASNRYERDFRSAFGADPALDQVGRALATYVRTIVAGDSPYDRHIAGRSSLDDPARRGLELFHRAGCVSCHAGPTLSDERFHNTGIAWDSQHGVFSDMGRAAVNGRDEDRGAFKTPTLREVARTAPYMHDGSVPTLDAVVDFYDRGGQPNPELDPKILPLRLTTRDKRDLVAFLRSFSGQVSDGR